MIRKLSMAKAVEAKEHDPSIRLIDVRTPSEFREGHLPGAINVPLQEMRGILKIIPDREAKICVYCTHGFRAAQAAEALFHLGYLDITDIGGIAEYPGKVQ
jgi:phage shock protein E